MQATTAAPAAFLLGQVTSRLTDEAHRRDTHWKVTTSNLTDEKVRRLRAVASMNGGAPFQDGYGRVY